MWALELQVIQLEGSLFLRQKEVALDNVHRLAVLCFVPSSELPDEIRQALPLDIMDGLFLHTISTVLVTKARHLLQIVGGNRFCLGSCPKQTNEEVLPMRLIRQRKIRQV